MWEKLLHVWGDTLSPQQIYEKVRFFSWNYAVCAEKSLSLILGSNYSYYRFN